MARVGEPMVVADSAGRWQISGLRKMGVCANSVLHAIHKHKGGFKKEERADGGEENRGKRSGNSGILL